VWRPTSEILVVGGDGPVNLHEKFHRSRKYSSRGSSSYLLGPFHPPPSEIQMTTHAMSTAVAEEAL